MRAFIAIELPEEIKNFISQIQEKLKSTGADVKWVEKQNLHLTLKFLGEIDIYKEEKVKKILKELLSNKESSLVKISEIGAFPKLNFPRIIWVGIKEDQKIREIAEELEEKLSDLGINREKREFTSHITLGRVRSFKNKDKLILELKRLSSAEFQKEFSLQKVALFESILTPEGPIYKPHFELSLKII